MTTSGNQIRAAFPTGRDRDVSYHDGSRTRTVRVTVVEHSDNVMYAGLHPDVLAIPYDQIVLPITGKEIREIQYEANLPDRSVESGVEIGYWSERDWTGKRAFVPTMRNDAGEDVELVENTLYLFDNEVLSDTPAFE